MMNSSGLPRRKSIAVLLATAGQKAFSIARLASTTGSFFGLQPKRIGAVAATGVDALPAMPLTVARKLRPTHGQSPR